MDGLGKMLGITNVTLWPIVTIIFLNLISNFSKLLQLNNDKNNYIAIKQYTSIAQFSAKLDGSTRAKFIENNFVENVSI